MDSKGENSKLKLRNNLVPRASVVEREVEGPGRSWRSRGKFSNIAGKFFCQIVEFSISVINFPNIYIGKFRHVTTPGPGSITCFTKRGMQAIQYEGIRLDTICNAVSYALYKHLYKSHIQREDCLDSYLHFSWRHSFKSFSSRS